MKPVRTRKPARERKAEIVDVAMRLAADLGPDRLTTEKLAQAVGISQPGIFRHFPTKVEIWKAVADRIDVEFRKNVVSESRTGSLPQEALRAMVRDHLAFIDKTPAIPAILFSRELHAENEDLRLFFVGLMVGRQKALSAQVRRGIEQGVFDAHLDPEAAGALILTLIQGLAMRWSLNERSFDLVGEGERLFEIQMRGFAAAHQGAAGAPC